MRARAYFLATVTAWCAGGCTSASSGSTADASGSGNSGGATTCPNSGSGVTLNGNASFTLSFPTAGAGFDGSNGESYDCCNQVDLSCVIMVKAILGAQDATCGAWTVNYYPETMCTQQVVAAAGCTPGPSACNPATESGKTSDDSALWVGANDYTRDGSGVMTLTDTTDVAHAQLLQPLTVPGHGGYFDGFWHGYYVGGSLRVEKLTIANGHFVAYIDAGLAAMATTDKESPGGISSAVQDATQLTGNHVEVVLEGDLL